MTLWAFRAFFFECEDRVSREWFRNDHGHGFRLLPPSLRKCKKRVDVIRVWIITIPRLLVITSLNTSSLGTDEGGSRRSDWLRPQLAIMCGRCRMYLPSSVVTSLFAEERVFPGPETGQALPADYYPGHDGRPVTELLRSSADTPTLLPCGAFAYHVTERSKRTTASQAASSIKCFVLESRRSDLAAVAWV